MNLALFLTKNNIGHVAPLIQKMDALQEEIVNGALIVLHDSMIPLPVVRDAVGAFARKFKVSHMVPGQLNSTKSDGVHISALFALLMRTAYTRFPGPWLMFDEPAEPAVPNFMQAVAKQHGSLGGGLSGRAILNPGSALPVGPFVLNAPISLIKVLRYPTEQSWRDRGQHIFARSNFRLVPQEEWLFRMSGISDKNPLDVGFITHTDHTSAPVEATQSPPDYMDNYTNAELVDILVKSGSPKPHHFTGRDKLLALARQTSPQPA